MLAFEARLSAEEGNLGFPYVSDDIGSYNGLPGSLPCGAADELGPAAAPTRHLPDDLYARWVQFGTFQPLDRLHSNHGDRLPWEYGAAADQSAVRFLQLREALGPYIYTLARGSYDSGLPITAACTCGGPVGRLPTSTRRSSRSGPTWWSSRSPPTAIPRPPACGSRRVCGSITSPASGSAVRRR
jgi:Glycosyl hydrolases family 31